MSFHYEKQRFNHQRPLLQKIKIPCFTCPVGWLLKSLNPDSFGPLITLAISSVNHLYKGQQYTSQLPLTMDQNSCQNRTTCSKSNIYHRLNCLEKNCSTKVPSLTKTMSRGSIYSSPIKEYNMECILCKQGDVLKPYITCVLTQSLVATPLCKLKMFSPSPLS